MGTAGAINTSELALTLPRMLRNALKSLWIHLLFLAGLLWWAKWRLARKHAILVLAFHRVLTDQQYRCTHSQQSIVIRERTFAVLLRYIEQHYAFVNLANGLPAWGSPAEFRFAITFDDGWLDTYSNAFPVARRASAPFTVFICPGVVARRNPFWPESVMALWKAAKQHRHASSGALSAFFNAPQFESSDSIIEFMKSMSAADREHALEVIGEHYRNADIAAADPANATMSWDQIKEMANLNVSFGSHTLSHQILPNCPDAEAKRELTDSKRTIEAQLGFPCRWLAYPNGSCSPQTRGMVAAAGYDIAFSITPGPWLHDTDLLAVPRLNIYEAKVCDRSGKFSPLKFEYAIFWTAYCATFKRAKYS